MKGWRAIKQKKRRTFNTAQQQRRRRDDWQIAQKFITTQANTRNKKDCTSFAADNSSQSTQNTTSLYIHLKHKL